MIEFQDDFSTRKKKKRILWMLEDLVKIQQITSTE